APARACPHGCDRRHLMNRPLLSLGAGLAGGLVFGYLAFRLGLAGLLITLAFCAVILLISRVYMPYRMPWRTHAALLRELQAGGGPPADAQATESDLFARMQARARAHDWEGMRALLTDDFTMIDARGRRWSAKVYIRTLQLMRRAYPDLTSD